MDGEVSLTKMDGTHILQKVMNSVVNIKLLIKGDNYVKTNANSANKDCNQEKVYYWDKVIS